ncbi:MAG: diguanylate cyclase [Magnetococcales bacterium]|nr:diguanylate cyclase [Magnetococcales bacterium]
MSRPVDLLARYGGEEFVCLLPGADPNGLAVVGQKLLESVRNLNLEQRQGHSMPNRVGSHKERAGQ